MSLKYLMKNEIITYDYKILLNNSFVNIIKILNYDWMKIYGS